MYQKVYTLSREWGSFFFVFSRQSFFPLPFSNLTFVRIAPLTTTLCYDVTSTHGHAVVHGVFFFVLCYFVFVTTCLV